MPRIGSRGSASSGGFGRSGRSAVTVVIPQTLLSLATKVTPTKGSLYTLSSPGIYYVNLVELGYSSVTFDVAGGQGGDASYTGGSGGQVGGILPYNAAVTYLALVVGGAGSASLTGQNSASGGPWTVGGYNGGGRGVSNNTGGTDTGGGGGASDVRISFGSSVTDYSGCTRILVGAGGGGATSNGGCYGGGGAYPTGINGQGYGGSYGGTQTGGGGLGGAFGSGGENQNNTGWNGGGGGGWYGGGACTDQHGGGAGGSSYYHSSYISNFTYTNASRRGNGYIKLTVN